VLARVLAWLAETFGLAVSLDASNPAILFLVLIFLPALSVATWPFRRTEQRRKPAFH
jgi:hypothetical protein